MINQTVLEETALIVSGKVGDDGWDRIKSLALDSLTSKHSRRAYSKSLDQFQAWSASNNLGFTKATVQRYRSTLEERGLAPSSINVQMSAIRKLAMEAADNGFIEADLAAAIGRVKGVKRLGVRTGNWLTKEQAEQMLASTAGESLRQKRDRVILCLLVGCGIRREELANLTVEHVKELDGRSMLVDLVGKGNRLRTVPMPMWAKQSIDRWKEASGISDGRLIRPIKGDRAVGYCMSSQAVFDVVVRYGKKIGLKISPHDLRRSFAKLAHNGKATVEQIQMSLGHSSIQTTERYLGVKQSLTHAPCDHLGLDVA